MNLYPFASSGIQRPVWISPDSKQVVILIRGAFGSYCEPDVFNASAASTELTDELAKPENKDGFYLGVVGFECGSKMVYPITKATTVLTIPAIYGSHGVLNFSSGLTAGLNLLNGSSPESSANFLRPVVLFIAHDCDYGDPWLRDQTVAAIKGTADLVTVAIGAKADEALLLRMASSPQHFYRCANGVEFRRFLATVGAALIGSFARGQNATVALASLKPEC